MDLFLAIILMTLITLWTMILGMKLGKHGSSSSQIGIQMLVVGLFSFPVEPSGFDSLVASCGVDRFGQLACGDGQFFCWHVFVLPKNWS